MATNFINPSSLWQRKLKNCTTADQDTAQEILQEIHTKPLSMARWGDASPLFFRNGSTSSKHRVPSVPVRYLIEKGLAGVTIDHMVIPLEKPIEYEAPGVPKPTTQQESSVGRVINLSTQERQFVELLRILPPHVKKEIMDYANTEARAFVKEINSLLC